MRMVTAIVFAIIAVSVLAKPGDTLYTRDLQVEIKAEPADDAETLYVLFLGRKLVEYERRAGWVWVGIAHAKGQDGWVRESAVSLTDPDGLKW